LSIFPGRTPPKTSLTSFINRKPIKLPSNGATTMKATVLPNTFMSSTDRLGVWARADPANAPMSACDDELGSPHHQVSKFQVMAPSSVAKITL
jgi:hypothetical protein